MAIRYFLTAAALMLLSLRALSASPVQPEALNAAVESLDTVVASEDVHRLLPDPLVAGKKKIQPCIYDMPYSMWESYPDYRRLVGNSAILVGGGIATVGVLSLLPDDATAWNRKEREKVPMWQRYFDNVMHGPVVDKDNAIFNYVLHPYAGAAYYMSARSLGFNLWQSALYSAAVSTLFWEYGFEAFYEKPSVQDLILTPVCGTVLGELFYLSKRKIVEHDYELLGTKWLGYPVVFLLDPVNEFLGYFRGNPAHGYRERHQAERQTVDLLMTPTIVTAGGNAVYGFNLSMTF